MNLCTDKTTLEKGWRFKENTSHHPNSHSLLNWLPASVPGHVHTDLYNAGVINNPFERMAERGTAWIDETDWIYETDFHVDEKPADYTLFVFEGIDTVADIYLNEQLIADVDNMFIPHEINVGALLKWGKGQSGDNILKVVFKSAKNTGIRRLNEWTQQHPGLAGKEHEQIWASRAFVRKAQYMFGWDWGPKLISCGIWRPVHLIQIPIARLIDWQYDCTLNDDDSADITFNVYVDRAQSTKTEPLQLSISVIDAGNDVESIVIDYPDTLIIDVPGDAGRVLASGTIHIENAHLWWPNRHNLTGEGAHPTLYSIYMELSSQASLVDKRLSKIGIRTIELITDKDEDGNGSCFKFRVNGADIFARGANWIPADSFPSRLENDEDRIENPHDSRIHDLLWMACDSGVNMLRVWGGGLYESEHFYELCDEHGILVWQDFGYACSYYPDTNEYLKIAYDEAVAVVRRLRTHPCLALWCGNNENHAMYHGNWSNTSPKRFLGEKIYHEILPQVIQKEDPDRPYWPSSPYSSDECTNVDSPDFGDMHNWHVWFATGDWREYAHNNGRFISEFGVASSCGLPAWDSCLTEDDMTIDSPVVKWHDKTGKDTNKYLDDIALFYSRPKTLEDLVYYSQLYQADAYTFAVEHYRRLKGRCWGTLFWQYNDCWPVKSWSVIDYLNHPKAAYYAMKRFYAPINLSVVQDDTTATAHVVNDALEGIDCKSIIALKTLDGEVLQEEEIDIRVCANKIGIGAMLDISSIADKSLYYIAAYIQNNEDGEIIAEKIHFLTEPKNVRLNEAKIDTVFEELDDEFMAVTLQSETLAASVWLRLNIDDHLDMPELTDNFFHMEPNIPVTVQVSRTESCPTVEELEELLIIRTLNDD